MMKSTIFKAVETVISKILTYVSRVNLRTGLAFMMIGFLLGIYIATNIINVAGTCEVAFVSREELLSLEQERIKETKKYKVTQDEKSKEKELFYGARSNEIETAIKDVVAKHKGRKVKVIYTVYSGITGENVYSISKEVHAEVTAVLSNKIGKE